MHSGAVPASALLAVTFTARAAGEMRTRLRALGVGGVQARTFHAAAMKQLNYFWPRVVGGAPPRLVDNTFGMVANAAARARLRPGTTELRDLLAELDWAASTLVGPEDYPAAAARAGRTGPYDAAVVAQVYEAFRELKQAQGAADFNDLLLLTAGALEEHAGVAEEFRARYRSFVVDEYQDVTPLQQRLLDAWLGGRDDLCVVGDAHQTIYSFTGATPAYLLEFRRRFPAAQEVRLVRDYRSTPQVVGLANAVHGEGAGDRRRSWSWSRSSRPGRRRSSPSTTTSRPRRRPWPRAAGPSSTRARRPARSPCSTGSTRRARRTRRRSPTRVCPTSCVAGSASSTARRCARRCCCCAARCGSPTPTPPRAWPSARPTCCARVCRGTPTVRRRARARPASAGRRSPRCTGWPATSRRPCPGAGLRELVAELEERAAAQHAPSVEGVTLASLHAAKGLEWDAVFLVGLVDGTLPLVHAEGPAAVEEERRLLYVGVTRARSVLQLSWALSRSPGGRGSRRPSRFLDGLHSASARPAAARRARPAAARR